MAKAERIDRFIKMASNANISRKKGDDAQPFLMAMYKQAKSKRDKSLFKDLILLTGIRL